MTWGRVSCNGKMASLSHELHELVSLQTSRESSAIDRVTILVDYQSEIIKHCPLVMQQSLSQSEAFPPLSLGWPQPIRGFHAIEPGMLQCHNTKSYKKRCACTSGSSLEVPQLLYTLDLSQSVAL